MCVLSHSGMSDSLPPHGLYSLPGSPVHGTLQVRILEWVTIPFSRGSSRPRNWSRVSCMAGDFTVDSLPSEPPGKLRMVWKERNNKAETDVFLELSWFFYDPEYVGNLICGSSAFSKTSSNIWKFKVHILLKPGLVNFEHYFTTVWDECNCAVVCAFFGINSVHICAYTYMCRYTRIQRIYHINIQFYKYEI